LRERFGIPLRLNFYTPPDSSASPAAPRFLGPRSPPAERGDRAPRLAARRGSPEGCCMGSRLAAVAGDEAVDARIADLALNRLEVDNRD
jgi:Holliday junction DNA helicase RuvB